LNRGMAARAKQAKRRSRTITFSIVEQLHRLERPTGNTLAPRKKKRATKAKESVAREGNQRLRIIFLAIPSATIRSFISSPTPHFTKKPFALKLFSELSGPTLLSRTKTFRANSLLRDLSLSYVLLRCRPFEREGGFRAAASLSVASLARRSSRKCAVFETIA
jgi:hypothetical protein